MTLSGYFRTGSGAVRQVNEDNFCALRYFKEQDEPTAEYGFSRKHRLLAGVFDGIGGADNGEIASFIAAKTLARYNSRLPRGDWERMLGEMNGRINQYMSVNGGDMGSTAAIVFIDSGHVEAVNLGDSRIYLYSEGNLIRLSKDHNELQRAIDMNLKDFDPIKSGMKKGSLTKYLGTEVSDLNPHILTDLLLKQGDVILLCSDGLTDMVSEEEIGKLIDVSDTKKTVDALFDRANENGGRDNVTIGAITPDGPTKLQRILATEIRIFPRKEKEENK